MFRASSTSPSCLLRKFPNDLLSQKGRELHTYSTAAMPPCSGFAPDSLVQQNKNACPEIGSRICHKISRVLSLPSQWNGCLLSCLNAAHLAISGIEVGKRCPKRNPTAFLSGTVQGEHSPGVSRFFFLPRLVFHALPVFQLLLCLLPAVELFLFFRHFPDPGKLCHRASGCRCHSGSLKCLIPAAEPLFHKPPANDLLVSWCIAQFPGTVLQVTDQLFLGILSMVLFKQIFLLCQSLATIFRITASYISFLLGAGISVPPNTKSCGGILRYCRSRFPAKQNPHFALSLETKRYSPISVGLLACVSSDNLSAFSGGPNDRLPPTAGYLDTYSAGCAGTFTPFSCSAGQSPCAPPGHGNMIQLKTKKVMDAFQRKEHHHNHSKQYSDEGHPGWTSFQ